MKKTFLLLLFAVTFSAVAQVTLPQEYTIQKPLKLATVLPSESLGDSVLVRGVDKIVKYVPRSAFGGSIPLINDVLRSNPFDNQTDKTLRFFGDLVSGTYNKQLWISPQSLITLDPVGQFSSAVFPQDFYVSSGGSTPKQWGFNVNGFEFFGKNIVGESQFYANIKFPIVTTADDNRYIPLSVKGNYADANGNIAISDNDLQTTLNAGGFAEFASGDNYSFVEFPDSGNNNVNLYVEGLNGYSSVSMAEADNYLETKFIDNTSSLSFPNGVFRLSQEYLTHKTYVRAWQPTVNTDIYFPAPSVSGTYFVATSPRQYTVSSLPTPTVTDSYFAIVTDAVSPTYLGTLTGGGSIVCPVFYNGTTWVAH